MAMYISIGEKLGYSLPSGLFEIIIESTRDFFTPEQQECKEAIYETHDVQGQSFITLRYVDRHCFNLFYRHCESAMKFFPDSDRGKFRRRIIYQEFCGIGLNFCKS